MLRTADDLARELRLAMAPQRKSFMALAKMLGYRIHGAQAATVEARQWTCRWSGEYRGSMGSKNAPNDPPPSELPFPESLCHRCAAPPKYVRSARSTFILCPVLPNKYPRQPVLQCEAFVERKDR